MQEESIVLVMYSCSVMYCVLQLVYDALDVDNIYSILLGYLFTGFLKLVGIS